MQYLGMQDVFMATFTTFSCDQLPTPCPLHPTFQLLKVSYSFPEQVILLNDLELLIVLFSACEILSTPLPIAVF